MQFNSTTVGLAERPILERHRHMSMISLEPGWNPDKPDRIAVMFGLGYVASHE